MKSEKLNLKIALFFMILAFNLVEKVDKKRKNILKNKYKIIFAVSFQIR